MRRLCRHSLSEKTLAVLAERSREVASAKAPEVKALIERLWRKKDKAAFNEIRRALQAMAPTPDHCMYCEHNEATDIDHFHPKSSYPEQAFAWPNYLFACARCNSNEKRNQFPLDEKREPLLIDPTREEPLDHLVLDPATGKLVHRTEKGDASIRVYGLQRAVLEKARRQAWANIEACIISFAACSEDPAHAERYRQAVLTHPHASVFLHFRLMAQNEAAARYISRRCLEVIEKNPEILDWVIPFEPARTAVAQPRS